MSAPDSPHRAVQVDMDDKTLRRLEFFKVLDGVARFAMSEAGVEACRSLRPQNDAEQIARQAEIYRQGEAWLGESSFRVRDFPPLDGLFIFLENQSALLDLDALFALRQVLAQAREARSLVEQGAEGSGECRWPDLLGRVISRPWPGKTWSALNRCIAPEGGIKDSASPELMAARSDIRRIHQKCTKKAKEFILQHNIGSFMQEEFMTISSDRYVLPLRTNFKGRLPGIIHDYSQTGETCYFEPFFLVDINNELQELKQREREAEREVFRFLTGLIRQEYDGVRAAYDMLVDFDVMQAKAGFASALNARPVDIGFDQPLRLLEARHPLLALPPKGGRPVDVIPVDIVLGDGQKGLIISGGNAGGKTVTLKTLGLIALMSAAGLPVPVAEGSSVPLWNHVVVLIGDDQSLEDHVSTFTAQIDYLSGEWEGVGSGSLVILDEFGAGTDPSQGAALAQAVLDSLLEKGASVAAATHFPALKAYALTREEVRAATVLFDPTTKRPMFSLAYDQVGASQALDVAREHGLASEVLKRAEGYLLLDGSDTGSVIERLNEQAVAREKELASLRREREKLREKRDRLTERFEREQRRLVDEMQKQSQDILRKWQADKISHKQALKEMAKVRRTAEAEKRQAAEAPAAPSGVDFDALAVGEAIRYRPWDKKGVVEGLDPKKRQVKVDLAGVSMWVRPEDLVVSGKPGGVKGSVVSKTSAAPRSMRLDLRGMRADVAVSELSAFIDRALLDNFDELEVVHGRGTGALRREAHEFLKHCPSVRTYALAPEDRGGDGMTVVELK